jgi:hypothetical protein
MSSSCPGSPDNHSAWHEDPHVRDGIHVLFGELRLLIDGRGDVSGGQAAGNTIEVHGDVSQVFVPRGNSFAEEPVRWASRS